MRKGVLQSLLSLTLSVSMMLTNGLSYHAIHAENGSKDLSVTEEEILQETAVDVTEDINNETLPEETMEDVPAASELTTAEEESAEEEEAEETVLEEDGNATEEAVLQETESGAVENTEDTLQNEEIVSAEESQETAESFPVTPVTEMKQEAETETALIKACYSSDAFDEPVTLSAYEIKTEDEKYSDVVDSLQGYDYSEFKAYDISFFNANGEKKEPLKSVNVQIIIRENWTVPNTDESSLIHIDEEGQTEKIEDARINDSVTEISFDHDAFSVYVVTTKTNVDEVKTVYVGEKSFTTLAEAVEAANDGDVINIIGETADTAAVSVNKSLTLLSDGEDGYLPNGIDADKGTITLGGGSNTLKMGAVWARSEEEVTLNIENNVHITGSLPLYLQNENAVLNIHGGTIEQTVARDNWNTAVGVYSGKINEITGGTIIGMGDGIYYAEIGTISGGIIQAGRYGIYRSSIETLSGGTIQAGQYGLYMYWDTIGEISGGTITAEDNAICFYSAGEIGKISGGRFESRNGSALYTGNRNNDGVINEISGGVFIGKNAISGKSLETSPLKISGGVFKASSDTDDAIAKEVKVDFTEGVNTIRWIGQLYEQSYTVPDGYMPSSSTVSVPDVEGDFHFFAQQITVVYDGNGGKTEKGAATVEVKTTSPFETAENEFIDPDCRVFKEWNTAADGTGQSYAENVSIETNENMTLYAIWEISEGAVSIGDKEYNNIRAAMEAAKDGDTLSVNKNCADTSEWIVVDKSVRIIAGNDGVKSTNARLQVKGGKHLDLGDGSGEKNLTMTGTVEVWEGSLSFEKGVTLNNKLLVIGENSTASLTGGKISTDGIGVEVNNNATITEISGTEISTKDAAALFVRSGKVKSISGDTTLLYCEDDSAIKINSTGEIETISGGQFISKQRDKWCAALYVEGTLGTIIGGVFDGYLGLQVSGVERDATAPQTIHLLGGEFYGRGKIQGRGNAINLGQIDRGTGITYEIKNVTAVAEDDYAILVGHNNTVTTMENVTATGDGALWLYNSSYRNQTIEVGTIKDSTFTGAGGDRMSAVTVGRLVHIETIQNVTVDGSKYYYGVEVNSDKEKPTTVGTIDNCTITAKQLGLVSAGDIGEIKDTFIQAKTAFTIEKRETVAKVGTLSGNNNFRGDDGYAIENYGSVGQITGGKYAGTDAALFNGRITKQEWKQDEDGVWGSVDVDVAPATVTTISGGRFQAKVGIENTGNIETVNGSVIVVGTEGPAVKSGENAVIGTIKGSGIYSGQGNAIATENKDQKTSVEPGITTVIGDGRYNTDTNTPESQLNSLDSNNQTITIPAGYHMSVTTVGVDISNGNEFHYLVKDNTVLYDGNGHELDKGTSPEGFENVYAKAYESASATVDGNSAEGEFHFSENIGEDAYVFKNWNTEKDGSGTVYNEGDTIELNSSDVVLYAQFVRLYDVTFEANGGTPVPETQKIEESGTVTEPEVSRDGYELDGWYSDAEFNTKWDFEADTVSDHTTLYAKWNVVTYNIAYELDGGTNAAENPATYTVEDEVTLKDPVKEGYTFKEWKEGNTIAKGSTGDTTFTAVWEANKDTKYKVEHYTEKLDGTFELKETEDLTGTTDSEAKAQPKSYEGFTYDAKAAGAKESGNVEGDGSLVLKMFYTRNRYSVKFVNDDGTVISEMTYPYGTPADQISVPGNPSKASTADYSYSFKEWSPAIGEVKEAVTYTATYNSTPIPHESKPEPRPTPRPSRPVVEPEVKEEEQVPEVKPEPEKEPEKDPEVIIDEKPTPETAPEEGGWAVLNLISAIATTAVAGVSTLTMKRNNSEESEEEEDKKKRRYSKLLTAVPAAASIICFILTEDMTKKPVFTDKYTLAMVAMLGVNALTGYLTRNKKKSGEESR